MEEPKLPKTPQNSVLSWDLPRSCGASIPLGSWGHPRVPAPPPVQGELQALHNAGRRVGLGEAGAGAAGCCSPCSSFGEPPGVQAGSCHRPPPPGTPCLVLTHAGRDGHVPSANIFCSELAEAVLTLFIFLALFISYLPITGRGQPALCWLWQRGRAGCEAWLRCAVRKRRRRGRLGWGDKGRQNQLRVSWEAPGGVQAA